MSGLSSQIVSITFLGQDSAVVVAHGAHHKGARPARLDKTQTYVLVRRPDGWQVAAFHNTRHKRLLEAISFRLAPGLRPAA